MFPVQRDGREREVVVAGCGTRVVVFPPIPIGRLLDGCKPPQHLRAQLLPILVAKDAPAHVQQRGPLCVVIRRRADERRMVPGEIQPLRRVGNQQRNVFQDRLFPARPAWFSQVGFEQPVRFQPHVRVPIAVQARFVQSLLVLTRQQVSDANGLSQHPGVVITHVGWVLFCVEHRRRQDGVREMPPARLCFNLFEPGARQVVQAPFDRGCSGFQQPEVAGRERVGGPDRGADRSPQQSQQNRRAMGFHACPRENGDYPGFRSAIRCVKPRVKNSR